MITATHLTSGTDDQDRLVYTTGSINPTPGRLILLAVYGDVFGLSSSTGTPTISGNGLTWTLVATSGGSGPDSARQLSIFRAVATAPSAGAVTITFGVTQARCNWSISEFANIDITGVNGANAIVQSVNGLGSGTSKTLTLAAFSSPSNATYGAIDIEAKQNVSPGSGFTELGEGQNNDGMTIQTQFKDTNDTSVDWSWSSNVGYKSIAIELKHGGGGNFIPFL